MIRSILQNPWVVGIGGGIISGIFVFFLSNYILNKKNNSEYVRQIELANLEVIGMLKPYIADKGLPEKEVLDAIISSISRKYKVKKEEMFSIITFCQELIREIVENVYVSNDKKYEYTKELSDYIIKIQETDLAKPPIDISTEIQEKSYYRQKEAKQLSLILSFAATFIMFISILFTAFNSLDLNLYNFNELLIIVPVILICVLISIASLLSIKLNRLLREKRINESKRIMNNIKKIDDEHFKL